MANALIYFLLTVMAIFWLLPTIGMVIESFHCTGYDPILGTDDRFGIDNYVRLFCETSFLKWFGNTLLVGIVVAVVQTVFQISVGYALSKSRFRGKRFFASLIAVLGMFPAAFIYTILGLMMAKWNLKGSNALIGSILVYSASSGMGYICAKKCFDGIDRSIIEAARVDGASEGRIFFKIMLPLAKPAIVYTLLMGFLVPWNSFSATAPLPGEYLVADGMAEMLNSSIPDAFSTFCAGGVVISIPIVILVLVLKKYFVYGETLRNCRT